MTDKDRGLWEKYFGTWALLRFIIKVNKKEAGSTAHANREHRVLTRCDQAVLFVSSFKNVRLISDGCQSAACKGPHHRKRLPDL